MGLKSPSDLSAPTISRSFGNAIVLAAFRAALIAGLGLAALYVCYRLTLPFFTPLAAAFILAVLFAPFHRWMSARVKPSNAAAFVSVIAIAVIALAVLVVLIAQLVREAAVGAALVRAAFEKDVVRNLVVAHPKAAPLVQATLEQLNLAGLASEAASWLANVSAAMVRGSIVQTVGILLTFYLLFYFLRDRAEILRAIRSFLPFSDAESSLLFARAVDTVHATAYGMVVTGAVLGFLGGVIFAFAGLPAPILWGIVMAIFAILPVLGIAMVWVPAAIWLALNGQWVQAIGLSVAFTGLSIADSVVYPYLVGNRMRLHTAIAFIAALGGVVVFGPVGFVVGPLVISLTIALGELLAARSVRRPRISSNTLNR